MEAAMYMTNDPVISDTPLAEPAAPERRCYTVEELQKILGIGRKTVYELLKKHSFKWVQIGGRYRISKKSFDTWLDEQI